MLRLARFLRVNFGRLGRLFKQKERVSDWVLRHQRETRSFCLEATKAAGPRARCGRLAEAGDAARLVEQAGDDAGNPGEQRLGDLAFAFMREQHGFTSLGKRTFLRHVKVLHCVGEERFQPNYAQSI